jgi:uncharacterized protein (DUF58 family)
MRAATAGSGMSEMATASLTSLLDNRLLAGLERLRLVSRRRQTNRGQGEHLAGRGGTSTDFSDYRDYSPGDDVRYVDWNIFARLHRPYVKLYRFEEEMHVVILIDGSSSMLVEDKFLRARQLAAAMGMVGLLSGERVSVHACCQTNVAPARFAARSGRASQKRLFEFLEALTGGGDLPIERAVDSVLATHRGRGLVILLSDFLTLGNLSRAFNRLFSAGLEILALQILSPSELEPVVTGDLRLVDMETADVLDISSAGELLTYYHDQRLRLESELTAECRRRNGRFLSISSADPLETVLFDLLRRKGWMA